MTKTLSYEKLRQAAKAYRKNIHSGRYPAGAAIWHNYQALQGQAISRWDDVSFFRSDYLVHLLWQHPRQAFQDQLDTLSSAWSEQDLPTLAPRWLEQKRYRYLGRGRKKLSASEGQLEFDEATYMLWRQRKQLHQQQLLEQASIRIHPSIHSRWCTTGLQVQLCAPLEILNVAALHDLVGFSRGLLRQELNLTQRFPGYRYDSALNTLD